MPAKLGTALVIAQMALLASGLSVQLAMAVGLVASLCWIVHATKNHDKWLLITNATVGGFALWGLV